MNRFAYGRKPSPSAAGEFLRKTKSPAILWRGSSRTQLNECYFGAEEDEASAGLAAFFLLVLLWCFLWDLLVEAVWSVEPAGGSAASTGPAIRARAITGMSFLNIDVVSTVMGAQLRLGGCLAGSYALRTQSAYQPDRLPGFQGARIMNVIPARKALMTAK